MESEKIKSYKNSSGVSPLTLGTAQLGSDYGIANKAGVLDISASRELLKTALENGIISFDTSCTYSDSEERIGSFIKSIGGNEPQPVIVSKLPGISRKSFNDNDLLSLFLIFSF